MNEVLTIVLAGCGAVSRQFYAPALRALSETGEIRVGALIDPDPLARDMLARQLAAAAVSQNVDNVPESNAPPGSLCIVAAPPKHHLPLAIAAFARGWHVLCEKPMAATGEDCATMAAAGVHADCLLAVGLYKRFMPAHKAIKILIENQPFGPLRTISIAEGGKFGWPAASDSFFRKEVTPGGVLLDIGVHVLDLLLWWLDEPVEFNYSDDARDGLEANSVLIAEFLHPGCPNKASIHARVRLSRDWATENCYCFRFERATVHCRVNASNRLEITVDGLPMTLASELRDPLVPYPAPPTLVLESNSQAFIAQLVNVCDAVRSRRAPAITAEEGTRSIKWIEQCYARRKSLSEFWQESAVV